MKKVKFVAVAVMASALAFTSCGGMLGNNGVVPNAAADDVDDDNDGANPDDDDSDKDNPDSSKGFEYVNGDENAARNDPGVLYCWSDQWWCGSNVTVKSASENEGAVTFTYDAEGECTFGLQFFKYENIEAGKNYRVACTVSSNVAKTVVVNGEEKALEENEEFECSSLVTGDGSIRTLSIQVGINGEEKDSTFTLKNYSLSEVSPEDMKMNEALIIYSNNDESNVVVGDWNQFWWSGFSTVDSEKDGVACKAISFGPDAGACGAWTSSISFAPSSGEKKIVLEVTLYSEFNGAIKPVSPDVEIAFEGKAEWQTITVDYIVPSNLTQLGFIDKVGGSTIYVSDVRLVEVDK